jgi:hypothetical protein
MATGDASGTVVLSRQGHAAIGRADALLDAAHQFLASAT